MKVEEYNCLTMDTACAPNYTPNPRHRYIQAYYALNNDVILIGEADPCYISIGFRLRSWMLMQ